MLNIVADWRNTTDRKIISIPTPLGELCAEIVGASSEYPCIYTYIRREDDAEINLVAAEVKVQDDVVKAYLYGDTSTDEYTLDYKWNREEIENYDY